MTARRAGFGTILARSLFGLYGWIVFALCASFALLAVLLVPGRARRHWLAAAASRAIFILAGVPAEIRGLQNVPDGRAVVVANHASYVDGMLLKGYLPHRFSFVIKGEMRKIPIAHFLLRRSGSKFVERFESAGSARDARKLVKAAREGDSLAFFPEGTFRKEPGVGRFRAGAFVSAVKGNMPVVPIAITGTREMLPADRLWPWPVRPRFEVLPAIMPDDPSFSNHRELAEKARQQILAALGEPDLQKI
ncbi:MAG: 1-acyl-sn-glycerol-3-phosphate acyltransferase [Gammaproteobacteria bacterium]|nr:1-acyl-sn-glycerol-3-phosphate acyltransferase [Gammaproteobacteria bacterium]MDH3430245.1 1-acyl-sn-glycerol-3-phosphate acyltransferase [Gammaproteobacteria bacterium]MDH3433297.1 1-acyl-sn-glycerol-3-phosphate acyltransferase [Gammaproteobacteria bacterium]